MTRRLILQLVCFFLILGAIPLAAQQFLSTKADGETPSSSSKREKVFNAEHYTLDNGMQVVVIPNHRVPVVTHMVWYKVGAADERTGKSGIAHFLEHLMFKGSAVIGGETLAPGEFSETIRGLGGNDNAFTSKDYTAYFQSIPARHLEKVMRMEAGRMRGMTLPEKEVLSERNVIIEERRQRIDNDPRARFNEQMAAVLYINHPYGTPIIGWKHEMETLSRQDALDFYRTWYAPNNAVLVVSGDVTGETVLALAQKTYGTLPSAPVPERQWSQSPPLNSITSVTLETPLIKQPMVQKSFRVPSTRQNKQDALALQVLADIMGGGPTSRLYKSLVVEQKIASSAGLSYGNDDWDDSGLWVYATPLPGQTPDTVIDALDDALRTLIKEGVTQEEVSESVTRMQNESIYARDSLTGPAMIIGRALVTGSTLDDIEYWPDDIASVSAGQIQEVARQYLDPDTPHSTPPVTGFLLPEKEKEEPASPDTGHNTGEAPQP